MHLPPPLTPFSLSEDPLSASTRVFWLYSARSFTTPIEIDSRVRGEIFKILLNFVYSVQTEPKIESQDTAKDVLVAADRFECLDLKHKLCAESVLVDKYY